MTRSTIIRRAVLVAAGFVVLLAVRFPASWTSKALPSASILLADTEGTLWSGKGVLWIKGDAARTGRPLTPMSWHFEPGGLFHLELRWRLQSGNATIATLYLGANKLGVRQLQTQFPANLAAALSNGPVARFGWRGDIAINAPNWECNWQGQQCTGLATLLWQGAASDLLPIRELGDYQLAANAQGGNIDVQWHTLRGEIQTRGQAQFNGNNVQLNGTIAGNPELLGKLPNIAQGWVQAGQKPGEYAIAVNIADTQISR